jgi:pimeloyl-ACP methyl ester carboxylesterase
MPDAAGTPVIFLHGAWHGAWCWTEVIARVASAGIPALAVDMAGHGLHARRPATATSRPFDRALMAIEKSPVAGVTMEEAAGLFTSQAKALGGGRPVVAVAHSMGGSVLTRAAQESPGLFAHLVYLAAIMLPTGVSAAAFRASPEHADSRVGSLAVADPVAIGAMRIDPACPEPGYRQRARDAFYGDLDPEVADAAISLLSPDFPIGLVSAATTLTADGWGSVPRSYVLTRQDWTVRPAAQRKFIAAADAAFPGHRTTVHELDSAHSPFLSMPGRVADIVMGVAS